MKFILSILFLSSIYVFILPSKKQQLLTVTQKYLPDNYIVLQKYDEATVNFLASGDSLPEFIMNYPTIIHEGFHVFEMTMNSFTDSLRRYRLDDTTIISVRRFSSFPSRVINSIVPADVQKKVFRYDTYINSIDDHLDTQRDGFLGILEEFAAYYQSLKAYTCTYYFLKDSFAWSKPKIWLKYLNNEGSEIYAINEFKLFIAWYLRYAKQNRPDIYNLITGDEHIKAIFTKITSNSDELILTFLKNRTDILTGIKPFTRKVNGYLQLVSDGTGYGIDDHIIKLQLTERLLAEPENDILDKLKQAQSGTQQR